MGGRRRKKFDPSKNRKLDEFLTILEIDDERRKQILQFVEQLTFEKLKEVSAPQKKAIIRLKYPSSPTGSASGKRE